LPLLSGALTDASIIAQVFGLFSSHDDHSVDVAENLPMTVLSSGHKLPMVGMGVGNMAPEQVVDIVASGLQSDKKIRLIDTAHASRNEALVAEGIVKGIKQLKEANSAVGKIQVHVVTKIWYTYLGYERTRLSVKASFEALKEALEYEGVDLRVHMLIHWPRCFDSISWMDCTGEEEALPQEVKDAGPPPHEDYDKAWKETWRALEDLYLSSEFPNLDSIGVSNFHAPDLQELERFARVEPHILQGHVWTLIYDPFLIDYIHRKDIHFQAYNAIESVINKRDDAPHAYHHLQKIAHDVTKRNDFEPHITPAQLVLAWLIQSNVSIIPRTEKEWRLQENSPLALTKIPHFAPMEVITLRTAVMALLTGEDYAEDIHVKAIFHAESDLHLYWTDHNGGEVLVAEVKKGQIFNETTYPGHVFVAYSPQNKSIRQEFRIQSNFGEHEHFHVEL
jgi:diketogulonate reductase-like aldo/keto reductase